MHRGGGKAFTLHGRPSEAQGASSAALDSFQAKLLELGRENRRACKASKKSSSERSQLAAQREKEAKEVLQGRQLLQNLPGVRWASFKHSCPAVAALTSPTTMCADLGERTLVGLSSAWSERHIGVGCSKKPEKVRGDQRSPCLKAGTCFCGRQWSQHRQVWQAACGEMKRLFQKPQDRQGLSEGRVVMAWIATLPDDDTVASCDFLSVPLHYYRPWRPTFLRVKRVLSQAEDMTIANFAGVLPEGQCVTLALDLQDFDGWSDMLAFTSPEAFCKNLDLTLNWSVRFLQLSERNCACSLQAGQVRARTLTSSAPRVWANRNDDDGGDSVGIDLLDVYAGRNGGLAEAGPQEHEEEEEPELEAFLLRNNSMTTSPTSAQNSPRITTKISTLLSVDSRSPTRS